MKDKIVFFLLSLALLTALIPQAFSDEIPPMVVDGADLFTESEEQALRDRALSLRDTYEMDVVIVTTNSLGEKSTQDYADDYFDDHGYGYGENRSGVLFLISMEERSWYISTSGDGIYALTDYGIQQIGNIALDNGLSSGEYFRAFSAYLEALPEYFDALRSGSPIDGYANYSGDYYHADQESVVYYEEARSPSIFFSILVGLVVAAVVVIIMRSAMNTRRRQASASSYLNNGSLNIRTLQDMFLYSSVSKTRKAESSSGSGGGSSIHRSSGGFSHGGGGGKF